MTDRWLKPQEVTETYSIHRCTLREWVEKGFLHPSISVTNQWRYSESEVRRVLGIPDENTGVCAQCGSKHSLVAGYGKLDRKEGFMHLCRQCLLGDDLPPEEPPRRTSNASMDDKYDVARHRED